MSQANGAVNGQGHTDSIVGSFKVKAGLAQMLKGGVIMDVVNAEQVRHWTDRRQHLSYHLSYESYWPSITKAKIAEEAGAVAGMWLNTRGLSIEIFLRILRIRRKVFLELIEIQALSSGFDSTKTSDILPCII